MEPNNNSEKQNFRTSPQPIIGSVDGNAPQQPVAPNQQPETPPQKHMSLVKLLLLIIGGVLVLGVLSVITWFSIGVYKMQHEYNKLGTVAAQRARELESTIDNGVSAKPVVNGDILTASRNPDISSWATLDFDKSGALNTVEPAIFNKLSAKGYVRDGGDKQPYYTTGIYSENKTRVSMRYVNATTGEVIKIHYVLDNNYECPKPYVCKHTAKDLKTENSYPINGYGKINVTHLYVTQASSNSTYEGTLY